MSIRLTERQHELLGLIAQKFTAQSREGSRFAPEITHVEAIRMMIMLTAYNLDIIELNHEPREAFDLPSAVKKRRKP